MKKERAEDGYRLIHESQLRVGRSDTEYLNQAVWINDKNKK